MLREDQVRPRHDYVLIRQTGTEETGGLVLPSTTTLERSLGVVVRVGPGLVQPATTVADVEALNVEDESGKQDPVPCFGWAVPPQGLKPGDQVLFVPPDQGPRAPEDPDRIPLGSGLFLVRNHYIVAKVVR